MDNSYPQGDWSLFRSVQLVMVICHWKCRSALNILYGNNSSKQPAVHNKPIIPFDSGAVKLMNHCNDVVSRSPRIEIASACDAGIFTSIGTYFNSHRFVLACVPYQYIAKNIARYIPKQSSDSCSGISYHCCLLCSRMSSR